MFIAGVYVRDIGRKSRGDDNVSWIDILDSAESSKTSGGESIVNIEVFVDFFCKCILKEYKLFKKILIYLKCFFQFPTKLEQRKKIADEYYQKWLFPLCIGALDGKHIAFRPSKTDAALYYNYKQFYSSKCLVQIYFCWCWV